ncbi:MAG: DUF5074 domain-containing protein [Bacteroidales bacterium]|nr:DUF5074 domain-containing protein [Bacteroidales bacterium]
MKYLLLFLLCIPFFVSAADFSQGAFIINEDWYGHNNSTVNHFNMDDPEGDLWHYRVFQAANPGMELGCTAQHGVIADGKFFIISKQPQDPGATVMGGRVTVCDASTMEVITQIEAIDPSDNRVDGRAIAVADSHKAYLSTNNGVYTFDLDTYTVGARIEGTENPYADGDSPTNSYGSIYYGQCGSMVVFGDRLFLAHQSKGLIVVDVATDKVEKIIEIRPEGYEWDGATIPEPGIGSVVLGRDGYLYLSVCDSTDGFGDALSYLLQVDPATLEVTTIPLNGIKGPASSWYAWTPDGFCASTLSDYLVWNTGDNYYFTGERIVRYNTATRQAETIVDLPNETRPAGEEEWMIYGCSMRIHPASDEIYASVSHSFQDQTYRLRRYSLEGDLLAQYDMISNYWFPSIPVFPESDKSGVETVDPKVTHNIRVVNGAIVSDTPAEIYDLQGRKVADVGAYRSLKLQKGIYLIKTHTKIYKIKV